MFQRERVTCVGVHEGERERTEITLEGPLRYFEETDCTFLFFLFYYIFFSFIEGHRIDLIHSCVRMCAVR